MNLQVKSILFQILLLLICENMSAQKQQTEATGIFDKLSNLGEVVIDNLTFPTERGVWAIYPAGGYSSRTGVELGIMPIYSWDANKVAAGSVNTLTSSVQLSTKGMVEISSRLEWFLSSRWQLKTRIDWLRLNDSYWGAWSRNNESRMDYRSERYGGELSLFRSIKNKFYVGISGSFKNYSIKDEENPPQILYGAGGGNLAGFGPTLLFDSRDHVLAPRSGSYLNVSWLIFNDEFLSDYSYKNYLLDFRHFINIGQPVIAFQALWEHNDGDVPFFALPQLGGKERLRGIGHSNRVIDKEVWLIKSELRTHIWWRIGGVVFAEAGKASQHTDFSLNDVIYSGGLGLRFRLLPDEPLNIRLDAALSTEGQHGIFISLREAF